MKESEIRPRELFNALLETADRDMARFFNDPTQFASICCPGCDSTNVEPAFEKLGMPYASCRSCGTLYVSPRPPRVFFEEYRREGETAKFWSARFYQETVEGRREKIYRPRAGLVADLVRSGRVGRTKLADVGPGYGVFLEEVTALRLFENVIGIEPAGNLAEVCRRRGFTVVEKPVEAVTAGEVQADIVTCFEVLEHVHDVGEFIAALHRITRPGGAVLLTTLTISGFDLQVLWHHSKSIYPPHHINLLSVEGLTQAMERYGFQVEELTTPGQLDLDIVAGALREDPSIPLPRFVRYLLEARSEDTHQAFQGFLQEHRLSSHVRCLLRKS